jgi:hypothetical protein
MQNKITIDKNTNPYRDDIAAEKLRGLVGATKFIAPVTKQIVSGSASMKSAPSDNASQVSEALCGDIFEIYEEKDGYSWGQIVRNEYVGYIKSESLADKIINPNRKIRALRTYGFSIPKVQGMVIANLSMNAQVFATEKKENGFVDCGRHGWIYEKHLATLDEYYSDPAEVAQMFLHAPYYWGGVQSNGLDCSGLVETSFAACGIKLPRDAYMQEKCGQELAIKDDLSGLKRNDLIFWKGHVGIMLDEVNFIHANGWHMCVAIEPLFEANERYLKLDLPIRSIRRVM